MPSKSAAPAAATTYNADSITHMEDVEHVRHLPDMYIGDTGQRGLHHLINEIVNNSVDEVMAGEADHIWIVLHADNSISVRDNGRGIPPDINEKAQMSGIELAMTKLKAGGKFGDGGYRISGGLHGVGLSCVNFLSEWCTATIWRDGHVYKLRCERGLPTGPLVIAKSVQQSISIPSPIPMGEGAGGEGGTASLHRDDHVYKLRCERGLITGPIVIAKFVPQSTSIPSPIPMGEGVGGEGSGEVGSHSGTILHWLADTTIFGQYEYDIDRIVDSIRYICYLARNAAVELIDERGRIEPLIIRTPRGIEQFVDDLNQVRQPVGDIIYLNKTRQDEAGKTCYIEIAMQYSSASSETLYSFANHVHTKEGGVHVTGFRSALSRVLNQYARKIGTLKDGDENFTGDDTRDGLTAIVSVRLERPQFESNTKVKLNNTYMEKAVSGVMSEGLALYLEEHPAAAKVILDRVVASYRARLAAENAVNLMTRQCRLDNASLPGKLTDCIERDPRRCAIFLVEGDSAGGSAKGGRDRRTQAILPLRGKILNVDQAALARILENNEVRSLITAIGTGICVSGTDKTPPPPVSGGVPRNEAGWVPGGRCEVPARQPLSAFSLERLRYHRVIIMTDADVDGSHIRTLLLTFLFRYMRPVIEHGHVYMALPPLYSIRAGKNVKIYVNTQAELETKLKELKRKDVQVGRFKGLGEMNPEELYETTMNPLTRRLAQVTLDDAAAADAIFSILMSDRVEPRKQFIIRYAKEVDDVDWHC